MRRSRAWNRRGPFRVVGAAAPPAILRLSVPAAARVTGVGVPAAFTNVPGPTIVAPAASRGVRTVFVEQVYAALQFTSLGENARPASTGLRVSDVALAAPATTVAVKALVESAWPSASVRVKIRPSVPIGAAIVTAHCRLGPEPEQPGLVGVNPTDVVVGPPFGTLPFTLLIVKVALVGGRDVLRMRRSDAIGMRGGTAIRTVSDADRVFAAGSAAVREAPQPVKV